MAKSAKNNVAPASQGQLAALAARGLRSEVLRPHSGGKKNHDSRRDGGGQRRQDRPRGGGQHPQRREDRRPQQPAWDGPTQTLRGTWIGSRQAPVQATAQFGCILHGESRGAITMFGSALPGERFELRLDPSKLGEGDQWGLLEVTRGISRVSFRILSLAEANRGHWSKQLQRFVKPDARQDAMETGEGYCTLPAGTVQAVIEPESRRFDMERLRSFSGVRFETGPDMKTALAAVMPIGVLEAVLPALERGLQHIVRFDKGLAARNLEAFSSEYPGYSIEMVTAEDGRVSVSAVLVDPDMVSQLVHAGVPQANPLTTAGLAPAAPSEIAEIAAEEPQPAPKAEEATAEMAEA